MARSKKLFQSQVMTQLIACLNQPIGQNTLFGDALGKRVCHMYPQSSNQIGQYLKNAPYRKIMDQRVVSSRLTICRVTVLCL